MLPLSSLMVLTCPGWMRSSILVTFCSVTILTVKRGKFIGKLNSLSQEFHFVSPDNFIKILNIYAVSLHGSGLWNLFSDDCDRLYKAWNVAVRHAWNLPNTTHRYLIESISGSLNPKVMLASRYSKFVKSLQSSPKYSVKVLASMCSSTDSYGAFSSQDLQ